MYTYVPAILNDLKAIQSVPNYLVCGNSIIKGNCSTGIFNPSDIIKSVLIAMNADNVHTCQVKL